MKNIQESFRYTKSIADIISESLEDVQVDEGLKDVLNVIKTKFKQAYEYLKGIVVKAGIYYVPVTQEGEILPGITPMTTGQAYKEGYLDKNSTTVILNKEAAKIVGLNTNLNAVEKMYGSEKTIHYWDQLYESINNDEANVNEVKLVADDPGAVYNRICDTKDLIDEIKMHVEYRDLAPLLIWGAPGIGKTAIVRCVCDAMKSKVGKYDLIFKTLSNETPDNFTLPKYVEIDGQDKATDVPKTWLPVYKPTGDPAKDVILDENCGQGMMFIDELSRATPQVLNVILPLINEREFNGYKVGSGWSIIVASNRLEDDTNSQSELSNALLNRFDQVFYEPTVHTWVAWAEKQNYMSPVLLQWLSMPESENMSGGKFYYWDPNQDNEDGNMTGIWCSPRAWTNAMRKLARFHHTGSLEGFKIFDIPHHIIKRVLNGYIPAAAIDSFMAFLETVSQIGNFDRAVESVWKNGGKDLKIDKKILNKIALPLAQLVISAHAKELPTTEEFESLATWVSSTGSDQLASYILDLFKQVFVINAAKGLETKEKSLNEIFTLYRRAELGILQDSEYDFTRKVYADQYGDFFKYWKLNIDLIKDPDSVLKYMPNWYKGMAILGKKFGDTFKSAIIDGKSALG